MSNTRTATSHLIAASVTAGAVITLGACSSTAAPAPSTTPTAMTSASAVSIPASSECASAAAAKGAISMGTNDYYMVMNTGPSEQMYSQGQVQSMHPKSGEVMVAGTMMSPSASANSNSSSMPGMDGSSEPGTRHVEVAICERKTGKVLTGATPSMQFGAMSNMMQSMPVAEMYGVDAGPSETHYGNNMPMTAGADYTVTCTLNGQTATFTMRAS